MLRESAANDCREVGIHRRKYYDVALSNRYGSAEITWKNSGRGEHIGERAEVVPGLLSCQVVMGYPCHVMRKQYIDTRTAIISGPIYKRSDRHGRGGFLLAAGGSNYLDLQMAKFTDAKYADPTNRRSSD